MMSWDEACRRAGGRRSYNLSRHADMVMRWPKVVELWAASHGAHGWQADAARRLGVSPRTIGRDLQAILGLANRTHHCPLCGQPYRLRHPRPDR